MVDLKSYSIPRHKLGFEFLRPQSIMKLIRGGQFEFH